MKKILFLCCVMLAANLMVFGQSAQVLKKNFTAQVSRLDQLLAQSKTAEARTAWNEVNKLMMSQLDGIKTKMNTAASANNAAESEKLTSIAKSQFDIYSSVIRMQENMVQNRAAIKTKLEAFAAGI